MSSYGKYKNKVGAGQTEDRDLQSLFDRLLQTDIGDGREAIVDYLANHLDTNVERNGNEIRVGWLAIKLDNLGRVLSASSRVVEQGPKSTAVRIEFNGNVGDT